MEYKTFNIRIRDYGSEWPYVVHDKFGNWLNSFRSVEEAKEGIDEEADGWIVCPSCFASYEYLSSYGDMEWSCGKCKSDFGEPLYPAKGIE